jgi:hypothetical protein
MTNGAPFSPIDRLRTADRQVLLLGWAVVMPVALIVIAVNALSMIADVQMIPAWQPWVWEATSGVMIALLLWLPWAAIVIAPPVESWTGRWRTRGRFVLVHAGALLLFTGLHVAGFVLLRQAIYALVGVERYDFGVVGSRFVYELRKDLLSYLTFVAVFSTLAWARRPQAMAQAAIPASFDIRDGSRVIRVPVADILAVGSAGNYVNFHLADGGDRLMRATLAAIEANLSPHGFVRTHRSWLVNAARMTALQPDGSGDWTVELGDLSAPLSRRYPNALDRLRSGA